MKSYSDWGSVCSYWFVYDIERRKCIQCNPVICNVVEIEDILKCNSHSIGLLNFNIK